LALTLKRAISLACLNCPQNGVLSNFNSEPIDGADDPALLETTDSEQDVESKALLLELQKLVAAAGGLASA
jgi:hypothetical protein